MVKITFLGGCREVGRSGLLIESNNGEKCILDYGVRFRGDTRLPLECNLENLKAIALTHCHIDHSGALPFLYKNKSVPLFTNALSLNITNILINDMIRISNYPYPFGFKELNKLLQNSHFLKNGYRQKIGDNFYITFIDAGHIPGSVSILVDVDNKKILYTGDINNQKTNLVESTKTALIPEIDALIVESTYALRNHKNREDIEKDFVDRIVQTIENGGKVLVPAFGVARSQEILLILDKYKNDFNGKIFIDGLATKISKIYLDFPGYLKNYDSYKNALNKANFISRKGRKVAKKSNGVIIAPSGMLKGGVAINFVQSFLEDPNSAIYLVGYQVEGSPGRNLLDKGILKFTENDNNKIREFKIKARCDYNYFDFSSHADGTNIRKYIDELQFRNGAKFVFTVHGDKESTISLASELSKKSYISVAPEIGESYRI